MGYRAQLGRPAVCLGCLCSRRQMVLGAWGDGVTWSLALMPGWLGLAPPSVSGPTPLQVTSLHGLSTWPLCVVSPRGLSTWPLCVASPRGLSAWPFHGPSHAVARGSQGSRSKGCQAFRGADGSATFYWCQGGWPGPDVKGRLWAGSSLGTVREHLLPGLGGRIHAENV